jgi:hypothetical protein
MSLDNIRHGAQEVQRHIAAWCAWRRTHHTGKFPPPCLAQLDRAGAALLNNPAKNNRYGQAQLIRPSTGYKGDWTSNSQSGSQVVGAVLENENHQAN